MIAIVHSIYSQSVHALALNDESMDNQAGRYCKWLTIIVVNHTEINDSALTMKKIRTMNESVGEVHDFVCPPMLYQF